MQQLFDPIYFLESKQMQLTLWKRTLCAAGLALVIASPAQALITVATFEDITPNFFLPPEAIAQGAYTFTVTAGLGVVDTSAAFGAGSGLDLAGPTGNASKFFIGLNDASMRLRATDSSAFWLRGLDFGFVSALTQLFAPGQNPGQLVASYETQGGSFGTLSWSFGNASAGGTFSFRSLGLADMAPLSGGLRQIDFSACTYDLALACVNPNSNFSQFAMDNISVSNVPEPGSLLLMALGLGLVGNRIRRRA